MNYTTNLEPISKSDLANIRCFDYVNTDVADVELEQWDRWFLECRRKPEVYSISNRGKSYTFVVHLPGREVQVDWRVYRTWGNTFHIRYKNILERMGISSKHPHIHPEKLNLLVQRMESEGLRPLSLSECQEGVVNGKLLKLAKQ